MLSRLAFRLILALVGSALSGSIAAPSFDLADHGRQIVALDGLMRFHPGDDPTLAWAEPSFDDSSWSLIRGDKNWHVQGSPVLRAFAWYRFEVRLPSPTGPLALWVPMIATNFQIYADGRLIAENGAMPPPARPRFAENLVFPIPPDLAQSSHPLTIAIRVWFYPSQLQNYGGIQESMQLGDANLLRDWQTHRNRELFWANAQYGINGLVCLLAGLGSLLLFLMRPADREFLWFGVWEIINVLATLLLPDYSSFHSIDVIVWLVAQAILIAGLNVTMPTMIMHLRRIHRGRLYWTAITVALLDCSLDLLFTFDWIGFSTFFEIGTVMKLLLGVSNCGLLFAPSRESKTEKWVFALPVGLYFLNLTVVYVAIAWVSQGATWAAQFLNLFFNGITQWPFPLGTFQATGIAVQLALFAVVVLRFVRTRGDEERYKNELEAARVVQQVLVPSEIPTVPGFTVESVYKPAGQVGGDFFQIFPIAEGGVLVAVGDVSGKGMPAAMTVSLLVGTLRTLAHYTQSPSEILAAMNQRMLARSSGGFTTCLVLTVSVAGKLTAANAGHIPPYSNGCELAVANGLPLGLSAHEQYTESVFTLGAGEQLTLMTDGVVEARATNGELLGFERVNAMITQSADFIAQAAQNYGQDDDITVLTLRLAPA
jgi:Stage II sporulation protein E (SpoIIE)